MYLSQEEYIRYKDQLATENSDWQWLIDIFDSKLNNITFDSVKQEINQLFIIYNYFTNKILLDLNNEITKNTILRDIITLANITQFNKLDSEQSKALLTPECKFFFLILYINELMGIDTKVKIDHYIFLCHNYFKYINMEEVFKSKNIILILIEEISLAKYKPNINYLISNLNCIKYDKNDVMIENIKDNLLNFKEVNIKLDSVTVEYLRLIELLNYSFQEGKLVPIVTYRSGLTYPDTSLLNKKYLNEIKIYFKNHYVSYVIETILYIHLGILPNKIIIDEHMNILLQEINTYKKGKLNFIFNASAEVISKIFKEKNANAIDSRLKKQFILVIQTIEDYPTIKMLNKYFFPISKTQKDIIRTYYIKAVSEVKDMQEYGLVLDEFDCYELVDQTLFEKISERFFIFYERISVLNLSSYFIDYRQFLSNLLEKNIILDKYNIYNEINRIITFWQKEYPKIKNNGLQEIKKEGFIKTNEIDYIENNIIHYINSFTMLEIMDYSESNILHIIENASSNPLSFYASVHDINEYFPYIKVNIANIEKKENLINFYISNLVRKVISNKGYRFDNIFELEKLVVHLDRHFESFIYSVFTIFNKHKELYDKVVKNNNSFNFLKLNKKVYLGHLLQLFPLLELKIHELGTYSSVLTIKPKANEYMHCESVKILSSILEKNIEDGVRLEELTDLLFVVKTMYSGEYNIRNKCVHGTGYLEDNEILFGFKITLSCIQIIENRIDIYR